MHSHVGRSLRIVLLGPPGSGKGTHGRRLAESLGLAYLSTGALLRREMELGSSLGEQAIPILARGGYLPDELMFPVLADWLRHEVNGAGWVLDGFPRSLPQAQFLDDELASRGTALDAAVTLEVPFADLLDRIRERVECQDCQWSGPRSELDQTGGCPICHAVAGPRADDSEENFRSRHNEFLGSVLPVIDRYRQRGVLSPCDATAPREVVAARLLHRFQGCLA